MPSTVVKFVPGAAQFVAADSSPGAKTTKVQVLAGTLYYGTAPTVTTGTGTAIAAGTVYEFSRGTWFVCSTEVSALVSDSTLQPVAQVSQQGAYPLADGYSILPRESAPNAVSPTSGTVRFTYFQPKKLEAVNYIRVDS